ncbi:putative zinc finger/helix-turn-helix protein, YgiT family [Algoriella xinjiangensis]|uniref:helix-turn-helix domain-containing protein n=1 Tax=Algoriella xinjiangensis TaxID=684065 RepID=UPI000F64496B|nr:helix-turn-helix domain-containing protein [Algoriella xinjiangensis]VDH16738.1 putative zinc finger/helix-turn-helix protein, YgiT family [Algoriella xinjiangensis]
MNQIDIKKNRQKLELSQLELANLLGVSVSAIRSWEQGTRNISKTAEVLFTDIIKKHNQNNDSEATELPQNYIRVPLVPVQAQAGLLLGYGDVDYWNGLPTEVWEVDKEYKGKYVVFEVKGDSMDDNSVKAILEGDRLLCREIRKEYWFDKLHINKWNFVIVHKTKGVVVKRIIDHNTDTGDITCHSLNEYYEDFTVNLKDVVALYNVVDLKRNLKL